MSTRTMKKRVKKTTRAKTADNQRKNSGKNEKGQFAAGNKFAFRPGQSGNPKGRPKGMVASEYLRKRVTEPMPGDPEGRTISQVIEEKVIRHLVYTDPSDPLFWRAYETYKDRIEGKAPQSIGVHREPDVLELDIHFPTEYDRTDEEVEAEMKKWEEERKNG